MHDLPAPLRTLLDAAGGVEAPSGIALYRADELAERQETYEVARYLPGAIAIGDDGGGRLVLLDRATGRVSLVDAGALGSDAGAHLADDLFAWFTAGAPLPADDAAGPASVDVYLERAPRGGAADLVAIRRDLGLPTGLAALRASIDAAPVRLLRAVPYGRYAAICRRLNQASACLGLRAVDDPDTIVPI